MNEQQDENNQRLSLADLEALSFDSLSRLSAKTHQAKPLARRIARAEAEGRARAGLRYLLHCLEDLALGRCDGGTLPKLQPRQGMRLHCDIANGFLPTACDLALPEFLQIAEAEGAACLAFANGYSPGFSAADGRRRCAARLCEIGAIDRYGLHQHKPAFAIDFGG